MSTNQARVCHSQSELLSFVTENAAYDDIGEADVAKLMQSPHNNPKEYPVACVYNSYWSEQCLCWFFGLTYVYQSDFLTKKEG